MPEFKTPTTKVKCTEILRFNFGANGKSSAEVETQFLPIASWRRHLDLEMSTENIEEAQWVSDGGPGNGSVASPRRPSRQEPLRTARRAVATIPD